jgi:hypothetical protein
MQLGRIRLPALGAAFGPLVLTGRTTASEASLRRTNAVATVETSSGATPGAKSTVMTSRGRHAGAFDKSQASPAVGS